MEAQPKTEVSLSTVSSRLRDYPFPKVDAVVGIREGGVVPACLIAHELRLPVFFLAINFRAPDNRPRHEHPQLLEAPASLPSRGSRVLLVDDVSVSGKTFERARACLTDCDVITFALKGRADHTILEIEGCVKWPWNTA
jgi:adenine/guanine phosphoribosyltransferase-like PRPP-binding protein